MEPSESASQRRDSRLSITIHKITVETKLRFNTLCAVLSKPQYQLFEEMMDLYWRNLDYKVPSRKQAVIARKLLDEMHKLGKIKKV
jgi:hypothetical protein